jgi:hypothetical protein
MIFPLLILKMGIPKKLFLYQPSLVLRADETGRLELAARSLSTKALVLAAKLIPFNRLNTPLVFPPLLIPAKK